MNRLPVIRCPDGEPLDFNELVRRRRRRRRRVVMDMLFWAFVAAVVIVETWLLVEAMRL